MALKVQPFSFSLFENSNVFFSFERTFSLFSFPLFFLSFLSLFFFSLFFLLFLLSLSTLKMRSCCLKEWMKLAPRTLSLSRKPLLFSQQHRILSSSSSSISQIQFRQRERIREEEQFQFPFLQQQKLKQNEKEKQFQFHFQFPQNRNTLPLFERKKREENGFFLFGRTNQSRNQTRIQRQFTTQSQVFFFVSFFFLSLSFFIFVKKLLFIFEEF